MTYTMKEVDDAIKLKRASSRQIGCDLVKAGIPPGDAVEKLRRMQDLGTEGAASLRSYLEGVADAL